VAELQHRLTLGATQGAAFPTGWDLFSALDLTLTFSAVQGPAQPSGWEILNLAGNALTFAVTQGAATAIVTIRIPGLGTRTCLDATYDRRTDLAATRSVVTELTATYDRRTDLAAKRETC
jgi:hypothetical protein